jgi:hypothetical protein
MSQNFSSIFSESSVPKSSEDQLETKMSMRADTLKVGTSYEDFIEDTTDKEIRLRKDEREKRFKDKRLQQQIKIEVGQSLKDQMTVAKDIYEECTKMKVTVNILLINQAEELPHYMSQFKSEDPKVQYVGLVGIRKILAIRIYYIT